MHEGTRSARLIPHLFKEILYLCNQVIEKRVARVRARVNN